MSLQEGYYRRKLPHWQPEGAALFPTWRLHGSLPFSVLSDRVAASGREFVRLDRRLDASRSGPLWLRDPRVATAVVSALHFAEQQLRLCQLRAWVLMPNHVHLVLFPQAELWRITKAIKGFSARQANLILGRTGQPFWEHESFDHWVRDRRELERIVGYVERNPVQAGLTESPETWPWSSAASTTADPTGRLDKTGVISHVLPPNPHSYPHEK